MSGAIMNYDFGPKRHWRRWVWNRIAERVPNARDALVLYLPGTNDFDRPIALSKGFCGNNLIGVERNPTSREILRKRGVLTVDADFNDAVLSQAARRPVGVVFGDLCCGLDRKLPILLHQWMQFPQFAKTVFAFNLLRGRDADSNGTREILSHGNLTPPLSLYENGTCKEALPEKHRGLALATTAAAVFTHLAKNSRDFGWEDSPERSITQERFQDYFAMLSVAIFSYRSPAHQTFDTVVLNSPRLPTWAPQLTMEQARRHSKDCGIAHEEMKRWRPKTAAASRAVAAVLAHRTMRAHPVALATTPPDQPTEDRNVH